VEENRLPRRTNPSLTIAYLAPSLDRLRPPADLGEVESEVFRQTVAAAPLDHFASEDLPLLSAYCRAVVLERTASAELATGAVIGSVPSPWLAVHAQMVRALSQLTVRLRIGPRSRAPSNNRRAAGGRTPSAYDLLLGDANDQA
jgi:phage terminase small subunit